MSDDLIDRLLAGEERAAARLMRLVDDRAPGYRALLKRLYPHTGHAYFLGVTGAPGAGKSTLVDRLIASYRAAGKKVGVLAVDPTSPYSGGAILGDRIRMQRHFLDPGVFIRSLATRGHMGGLSQSAGDVLHVLDAFGCDVVLVETVGVGQDELEIARLAHTVLVVLAPGLGDDIQAIKAGILEIGDVFVVNKADRDGADAAVRDAEHAIALGGEMRSGGAHGAHHAPGHLDVAPDRVTHAEGAWVPPVLRSVALRGEGIDALVEACEAHRAWLATTDEGAYLRAERLKDELDRLLRAMLFERATRALGERCAQAEASVVAGDEDPYTAAERLVAAAVRGEEP